jgi:phosphoserine phosphatase RsbU/P
MESLDHNNLDNRNPTSPVDAVVEAAVRLDRKVRQLNRDLSSVRETSQLLNAPMELNQILEIVVKTVAESIGADAAGLRLLDEETGELRLKATFGLSEDYANKGPVTAGESTLNRRALQGEAVVTNDMRSDPHFERYRAEIAREGLVSNLTIGLTYKDKGIGILRLYSKRKRRFSGTDISLAQTVAAQSAAAIINARLYRERLETERVNRQLRLAGDVQRHLIPTKAPCFADLDVAGTYVPCYEVGGDFYDYICLPDGHLVLAIGDVMGKGVPASLAMASLRSSLRAYAELIDLQYHIQPEKQTPCDHGPPMDTLRSSWNVDQLLNELIRRVNQMFCRDNVLGDFATLFCARLNPNHNRITYCNCGHEPPILIRGEEVLNLAEGGIVVGVEKEYDYEARTVDFLPGDMLVMYTDGLADAANFQNEHFGRNRIIAAAQESQTMTAEQAAKNIIWLMRKFAGLTQRADDTALVVIKKTA